MKKLIFSFILFSLIVPRASWAQTPSENQQINELKNKVASKVASLKLVEKRGVIGTVASSSQTEITINDINNNQVDIDVDELTEFSSDQKSSYGISDIKKGSEISVIGLYNKDSRRILARFVDEVEIPLFLQGVITDKNSKDFTVSLSTKEGNGYTVDIEDVTRTLLYSENGFDQAGFSKIPNESDAILMGFPNPKDQNRITAGRIIIFPGVPKNPGIQIIAPPTFTPTPSK